MKQFIASAGSVSTPLQSEIMSMFTSRRSSSALSHSSDVLKQTGISPKKSDAWRQKATNSGGSSSSSSSSTLTTSRSKLAARFAARLVALWSSSVTGTAICVLVSSPAASPSFSSSSALPLPSSKTLDTMSLARSYSSNEVMSSSCAIACWYRSCCYR